MRVFLSALLLCCLSTFSLLGQDSPVKYSWEAKHLSGNEFEIVFKAKIQDGWYTYSQFLESDDGPRPTVIEFESANEKKLGKSTEKTSSAKNKISGFDKLFEMNITKYKKDLTIKQKIEVTDPSKDVAGYLTYMTCDDTQCRPPTDVEFSFNPNKIKAKNADNNNKPAVEPTEKPTEEPTEVLTEKPTEEPQANTNNRNPATWNITFNKISDNEVELVATAKIADGWYVYSQKSEGDDGPIPTSINFEGDAKVEEISNVESASTPEYKLQIMDEVFEMQVTKYKHDFTITQRLKVTDASKDIVGYLNYMTCDDTKCIAPKDVEFKFSFSGGAPSFESASGTVKDGKFNPERAALIASVETPLGICDGEVGQSVNNTSSMGLLTIFFLGLIGGFVALLTPCVFPMIPMTVSLFSKGKKKSKAEAIKNALIFGGSIIVIYVALGLLVTGLFGADALNQLSTHWLMNLAFFFLFTIFAFSFFGYFEITLPSSWANKADKASMKGGLIGTFFGAFSICLVSFSCTGPIIGSLLVEAIKEGFLAPAIGMFGFALALAMPFTLFAAFPSWLQSLPSSGGWMTSMKVVLGFLELALGLKFLSTADLTEHWGIMPYELFVGLWAIIFGLMTLYLFGLIRFPHDNPSQKISLKRKGLAALSGILTVSILSGFMTNPQTDAFKTPFWLSGLAPSACYSYIKPCPVPEEGDFKFSDHSPPGIKKSFDDYDEAMRYAKVVNKPVLVDFTGYGCVNCRKMEENVWIDEKVNKILNEDYVLVSLYVDDRKKLPATLILENSSGTKIRNVGNKWAAFQEVNFKKQSQPYYVLVSPDEKVLNKPRAYTPDIPTYKGFLECGLQTYKENYPQ